MDIYNYMSIYEIVYVQLYEYLYVFIKISRSHNYLSIYRIANLQLYEDSFILEINLQLYEYL